MRRFWPFFLALLCWLLVLLVPATRHGSGQAWKAHRPTEMAPTESVEVAPGQRLAVAPEVVAVLKRHPCNRDVIVYGARQGEAAGAGARNMETLGRLYPRDAYVVTLQLGRAMRGLTSSRVPGSLTNPNYPKAPPVVDRSQVSPPEKWGKVIMLARQGQQLQPQNSFFDWMLIYALYGTEQDDEARRVLAGAVKKTQYNGFSRDAILNSIAFMRLEQGSPLPPRVLLDAQNGNSLFLAAMQRQAVRWGMETVIADRKAGRHSRALDTAFNLASLARTMRREGYSFMDHLIAVACESIALQTTDERFKNGVFASPGLRVNASLAQFQSHPRGLYLYAKQQGRSDLLPILAARWNEKLKWYTTISKLIGSMWAEYSLEDAIAVSIGERLRSLIVHALPSVMLTGIVFWLLSRRFRGGGDAASGEGVPVAALRLAWARGSIGAFLVLVLAMALDIVVVLSPAEDSMSFDWRYDYMQSGLLQRAPLWVTYGLAAAIFCCGISAAIAWQKQRGGQVRGFKQGLKATFEGSDDELASFDFGWLFGWVARLSFWIVFLGGLGWLVSRTEKEIQAYFPSVLVAGVLFSLALHFAVWRRGLHRRQTARMSSRLVAEAMGGFFVVASLWYAGVAFVFLPKTIEFDRQFESVMRQGEMKIARAKFGL